VNAGAYILAVGTDLVLRRRKHSWAWWAGYHVAGLWTRPPINLGPASSVLAGILLQVLVRTIVHSLK
jgi:hypothetical protein